MLLLCPCLIVERRKTTGETNYIWGVPAIKKNWRSHQSLKRGECFIMKPICPLLWLMCAGVCLLCASELGSEALSPLVNMWADPFPLPIPHWPTFSQHPGENNGASFEHFETEIGHQRDPHQPGQGLEHLSTSASHLSFCSGQGKGVGHITPESCQFPAQLSSWSLKMCQSLNGCRRTARRHLAVTARGARDIPMAWSLLPLPGTAVAKVLRAGTLSPRAGQGQRAHRVTARQHQKGSFPPSPRHPFSRHVPCAKLGFVLTMATLRARGAAVFVWLWKPKHFGCPRAESRHCCASPARGTNPASSCPCLGLPLLCPHAGLDMAHAKMRALLASSPSLTAAFCKEMEGKGSKDDFAVEFCSAASNRSWWCVCSLLGSRARCSQVLQIKWASFHSFSSLWSWFLAVN